MVQLRTRQTGPRIVNKDDKEWIDNGETYTEEEITMMMNEDLLGEDLLLSEQNIEKEKGPAATRLSQRNKLAGIGERVIGADVEGLARALIQNQDRRRV